MGDPWTHWNPRAELGEALERDEFRLVYQPVVSLVDGSVVGAEALLRWLHPQRGTLLPASFLPTLEEDGLIVPVGAWALRTACAQAVRWNRAAGPEAAPLTVGVNVSGHQAADHRVVGHVARALEESGLDPALLHLELTETVPLERSAAVAGRLAELRGLGVKLVLDDFGTGWCSLGYLTRFPIDAIKLDRSFVAALGHDRRAQAIVDSVIGLAQRLDIGIVAEGIETGGQRDDVIARGCSLAQGYFFGAPGPAARVAVQPAA
jgi:EAL domain-containing protein (putative c-di-GMP-specific phosphodiesterase class I)